MESIGPKFSGSLVDLLYGNDKSKIASADEMLKKLVGNLAGEKISLKDALATNNNKIGLIIGGSQASAMGSDLIDELKTRGFNKVSYYVERNMTLEQMMPNIRKILTKKNSYDVVIVYPDFKEGESTSSVKTIIDMIDPARCFVVIPPPATLKNGLDDPKREDFCEDLKQKVTSIGATAIDPRDDIADDLAVAVADKIFKSEKTIDAMSVAKKIDPQDLESNPEIASTLSKYSALSTLITGAGKKLSSVPNKADAHTKLEKFNAHVTSKMGMRMHPTLKVLKFHDGIDIGVLPGTPVYAVLEGTVELAEFHKYAGNYVNIRHRDNILTRYLHLSEIFVKPGEKVEKGQEIGLSGATGRVSGPHLHFETWKGEYKKGERLEPKEWLASNPDAFLPINFA